MRNELQEMIFILLPKKNKGTEFCEETINDVCLLDCPVMIVSSHPFNFVFLPLVKESQWQLLRLKISKKSICREDNQSLQ